VTKCLGSLISTPCRPPPTPRPGPKPLRLGSIGAREGYIPTISLPTRSLQPRADAPLITSRLALVEAGRAFHSIRARGGVSEEQLADAARELDALWARCDIWELTPRVCEMAGQVAPGRPLRTLDALHLATYLLARRRIAGLSLLTADERLVEAAQGV